MTNEAQQLRIWPGQSYPLGATWDGAGVNFALFSEGATAVELCLFDSVDDTQEKARISITERTDMVWHVYLPDLLPGQLYGFRVDGPWDPMNGYRFNKNKVLLDPYAHAIGRDLRWDDSLFGHVPGNDLEFNPSDSAAFAPLAKVVDTAFTWGDDRPPRVPWHKTFIYEAHVVGATALHPGVREPLRGTYGGIASEPFIEHLQSLGVTAVELLPVHYHMDERMLVERGKSNYWGYHTLGFFAPDPRYASAEASLDAVQQFKTMVRALHAAGIEVILDVVYNHTAEGNHMGPTLSWRGIDNRSYYRASPDPRYYMDFTGCGNTFNMREARVLQLIMDSLRYWVQEMHVDGFRFDLASTLARELYEVDKLGAFFDIIHQDPILSQVKLIAEPWDVGEGGYQVGNFPVLWTEWNGRYRDAVRRFWKGDLGSVGEFATRLSGSSDLYQDDGRKPYASINFVTCHDGFTLHDLVSYNDKHNEANGEDNRDGHNDNLSWNCGAEGPTNDFGIRSLRERQKRNFIATLFFSEGVPMLSGGDELGRTQNGNNNAYCHNNELNWYNWELSERDQHFLEFVRNVSAIWRSQPVLQRRKFFAGRSIGSGSMKDISWLTPAGTEMTDEAWRADFVRTIGMQLAGDLIGDVDEKGQPIKGDTLLALFNAHSEEVPFVLPDLGVEGVWERLLDTAHLEFVAEKFSSGTAYRLEGRSVAVLRWGKGAV